ncbi:MAG TPA: alpha/beta hydrolase domain-containing protein [Pseudonocardiaceae bacterium]|nr:alpha/beta hydrolase domain-containing protein [Pseudonocardiaceae bacterium]
MWLIASAALVASTAGVSAAATPRPSGPLPAQAVSQQAPSTPATFTVPKIPTVTGPIPRTETSIPIGTAYFPGAPGSVDLADYGYVEDEYFLSGTANVYQYDASGKNVEVKTPNVPYTTVILVRHPADPHKFSGRVQLEMSHPQFGVTTQVWAHNYKMFMADGDAWVRVTTSRGGPTGSSIGVAKQYNPTRYASLDVPEDGLNWDIIGQIAELLRSNAHHSPLTGFPVRQIFMEGFSGAGAIVQFWINDMSRILRQANGQSLIDGYVVGEPSGYPLINSQSPPIAADDPRQAVIPPGVPVVKLHSRPEPANQRRPDSDTAADRYRTYETAGAAHTDGYTNPFSFPTFIQESGTPWAQTNLYPFTCEFAMNDFPFENQWNLAINVIERWASEPASGRGHTWNPPHAARIAVNPDGTIKKDRFGNDLGGVRSPAVDVPTATYFDTNVPLPGDRAFCSNTTVGHVVPFTKPQLKALYPTHADYVRKVEQDAHRLAQQGWLLPIDVASTIKAAQQSDVP